MIDRLLRRRHYRPLGKLLLLIVLRQDSSVLLLHILLLLQICLLRHVDALSLVELKLELLCAQVGEVPSAELLGELLVAPD